MSILITEPLRLMAPTLTCLGLIIIVRVFNITFPRKRP